ncbi:imelysin family protein [Robiginitalea sp. M366]|uniref:imelysin family protein n=1 Tax=Robiginitalea aestuariiviva TaxID=3036903 RepID=UPI00240E83D7|nr:imelysin family protein [Robiginitalea aestuariiviva]MDG1572341.1 imelysin family protein [Robiginitalea aestuariiviva]
MKRLSFTLLTGLALLFGCSSDGDPTPGEDPNPQQFDRRPMLENWADNIIIPSYQAFLQAQATLEADFTAFAATPDVSTLQQVRQSWRQAYLSWQRVDMFEMGPAETDGLRLQVNTYPTDVALVESNINAGTYDLALPSNRDAKGFPALDYLLNGLGADDAAIVQQFSANAGYGTYGADVIEDISVRVNAVLTAWQSGYRDTFVNNDGASATASVDRFVNDYIFYYERFLRAGKMGIPLGVFTGTPAPQTLEAYYSPEDAKAFFLEGLDAVQDLFNGRHASGSGPSLASYLRELNTLKDGQALDQRINAQWDAARALVSGLGSFRSEIEENNPPTDMLLAYDQVQAAVPLLKVDMVSAMSIAIDFVDADGD